MKIIIDIPEKVLIAIQNGEDYRYDIHTTIAQGIPYEENPKYFPPCEDCNKKMDEIRHAYDKMKAEERPQGKWVKITKDGIAPIEYMCNICGRTIKSYHEEYIITEVFPFCHCGADMRGAECELL